jgi:hypothetical protein
MRSDKAHVVKRELQNPKLKCAESCHDLKYSYLGTTCFTEPVTVTATLYRLFMELLGSNFGLDKMYSVSDFFILLRVQLLLCNDREIGGHTRAFSRQRLSKHVPIVRQQSFSNATVGL